MKDKLIHLETDIRLNLQDDGVYRITIDGISQNFNMACGLFIAAQSFYCTQDLKKVTCEKCKIKAGDKWGAFEGRGKLYSAIAAFKKAYCQDETKHWPRFWCEFADQAFADLMAYEALMREAGIEIPKPMEKIE